MAMAFSTTEKPATAAAKKKRDQRRTGEPNSPPMAALENELRNLKKIC